MNEGYLAKVARALQSGRRFSDSDPTYLSDVTQLINQGLEKNVTDRQREEQQKIDAYRKIYSDQPQMIEMLLNLYKQNQLAPPQDVKAWY